SDNPELSLVREVDYLKKQSDEVLRNIANYENNLGFFKHAKTKNQIMIDTEQKISEEKLKLEQFKKKLNFVKGYLSKLKSQTTGN
ncbi:MAG: hypothetical protein ACK5AY_06225, partial [Bacteroidota bacterium]